jgi:RES domain-containing protein
MHRSTLKKIHRRIQEQIVGCVNCQPWDEGAPVWVGSHTDIFDLNQDDELTDDEWQIVLNGLRCPHCGTEFQDPFDEVQVYSQIDNEIEKIFARINDKRTTNSLKKFSNFIASYPYLGSHNSLGDKLFKSIKNGQHYSIDTPEEWYRARLINQESRMFHPSEMGAPNPQKVALPEGRFNHVGQAFLYLSNEKDTAHREINNAYDGLTIIQKFELSGIKKILDLKKDYDHFSPKADIIFLAIIYNGYVAKIPKKGSSWKPEYFVTRYIADVARYLKYEGIIFSSTVHHGHNLVLFNPRHKCVKPIDEPFTHKVRHDPDEISF